MALVVLLRGVNVGGHRTFRPAALAEELKHLDVVNIGAAGTMVVRKPIAVTKLRDELGGRLPFDTEIIICKGREIIDLLAIDRFPGHPPQPDVVRFVSVLSKSPASAPAVPMDFPESGPWLVKLLARDDRFLVGVYRRDMKAIACLGKLDRTFGVPVTTRNWNTVAAIAKVLGKKT